MHQPIQSADTRSVDAHAGSAQAFEPSFRVGGIVVLNSGGPPMTVNKITRQEVDGEMIEMVSVVWFASASIFMGHAFPAACLQSVQDAPGATSN